jgi:hypothetical protein
MNIDTDREYQEGKIEQVHAWSKGWEVTWGGWTLLVPNDTCQQAPAIGEMMRCYGKGIGSTVRGIAVNGRVYRYRTPAEERRHQSDMVDRHKRQRRDDYEAKRPDFDARVAALPEPFQLRIERFRGLGGNEWRYQFEPYELFTCEQAAAFAAELKTVDELKAFSALGYEEQRARLPAMSDGHSGNTFGAACQLAGCMITNPELVAKMHGAMCALAGCEEYGCFAAHEAKRGIEV